MEYLASQITALLLADGWHQVAGGMALDWEPSIRDPATGVAATPAGGPWVRFTEPDGTLIFTPLGRVQAIRHAPPPP